MPKIKISKKANDVIKKDKNLFVTTTRESYPFVADRGDGDFTYDISGNRFIDFSSFISVYNFGVNANAKVREAIKAQVDKLMHSAFTDYYAEIVYGNKARKIYELVSRYVVGEIAITPVRNERIALPSSSYKKVFVLLYHVICFF